MGINRNTPKAVVYGPHKLGGMKFPTMEIIPRKDYYTGYTTLRWDREIGKDILITLSAAQLSSGLTTPIIDDVALNITYLEEGVMSHLRATLKSLGGSLHIEGAWWIPHVQREGNRLIMEEYAKIIIGEHGKKITAG